MTATLQDTSTSSDGAMTVKNSNTPVSVGSMSQMVSVRDRLERAFE